MISRDAKAKAEAEVEVEVAQTTRALPREEPRQIRDGNSDLNQKIEHVVRKLCGGRHAPLLLQFWTLKIMNSPFFFVLQTPASHSFTVTPNDELRSYWEMSRVDQFRLFVLTRVSMCDAGWSGSALAKLLLPVYSPVSEPGLYKEYFVGMLEIVSNTKETCLQFFKDAGVCDLFQKEGLICSNVVPQHSGMQSRADEAGAGAGAEAEALLREEPRQIRDGNSDLNQKIEHVVRKLCGGRHAPLLLQFWTLKIMDSLFTFVLQTPASHSFTVTPNDELISYWEKSRVNPFGLDVLTRVSMSDAGWSGSALANLLLPVYSPVSEPGLYEEHFVGMLEIVSNTKETCLQFFKDAGVCDLFQKEGLICSNVVPQHLGMQLDVSTQGNEVPSNDFVDNTEQFTPKGDLNSKDQFVTRTRYFYKNKGVVLVIRSSNDERIYFRCERHGKTSAKKNGQISTKKCNCPFEIMGCKNKDGTWSLREINGSHNHPTQTF